MTVKITLVNRKAFASKKDFGDTCAQAKTASEVFEKTQASLPKFMEAHPEPVSCAVD